MERCDAEDMDHAYGGSNSDDIGVIMCMNYDESPQYWDAEKHFDLKWSIFQSYSIYKGYLVLFVGESLVDLLIF